MKLESSGCLAHLQIAATGTEAQPQFRLGGRVILSTGKRLWRLTMVEQRTTCRSVMEYRETVRCCQWHYDRAQVTKVGPLGGSSLADVVAWNERHAARSMRSGLPPHRYAMFLECFTWAINNNADGNLTYGWVLLNGTKAPLGAPCGGPSMRYSPLDGKAQRTLLTCVDLFLPLLHRLLLHPHWGQYGPPVPDG